jgi:GTPase SAR1 family protein
LEYDPGTVPYTTYVKKTTVRGCDFELEVGDLSGMEDFDGSRPLYYADVRVVLMCMDISNCDSLESLKEKVSARNREVLVQH